MNSFRLLVVRLSVATALSLFLISCSYTEPIKNIEEFVDYSSLADINMQGNYNASLYKKSSLSGNAVVVGQFCGVHKYPYEFDTLFDSSVETVLNKVYETVNLEILEAGAAQPAGKNVSIEMEPTNILLMCHPITEYNWECIATTKLKGVATVDGSKKYDLAVEARTASPAGGACGGGATAVSSSIGQAINDFSGQLYQHLTAE